MRWGILALLLSFVPPVGAQTLLYQHTEGSSPSGVSSPLLGFGKSVARMGDLDGDGVTEYAISSDGFDWGSSGHDQGVVRIYSGANGGFLYQIDGPPSGKGFGTAIAGLGDVDGDGKGDLAVGAPQTGAGGEVYLHSGADGHLIRILDNAPHGGQFGSVLDALGDLDGDGRGDLIVGAWGAKLGTVFKGMARVISGASGTTLYEFFGAAQGDSCGASVAGAGDVDADGTPDFAYGMPDFGASDTGTVRIHSGFDGSLLHEFQGGAPDTHTGKRIAGLGDANGDGFDDLTLTLYYGYPGQMGVLSGKDGVLLHNFPLSLYASPGRIGDVDGDGFDDVGFVDNQSTDVVRAYSGRTGLLIFAIQPQGFGSQLAQVTGLGDLNGDDRDDFIVGDWSSDGAGTGSVYSGATWVPPGTVTCKGDGSGAVCPCQGGQLFAENFDGGALPVGWTATGPWHVTSACAGCGGSDPYAYFGTDFTCNYFSAPANSSLISPPIQVPSHGRLLLDFCNQIKMDPEGQRAWVKVHGSSGKTLQFYAGTSVCCVQELPPYDITELIGQEIRIEFHFYVDAHIAPFKGWQVDDVVLHWEPNYGSAGEGCLNSTLKGGLLRAVGSSSKAADDLVLMATYLPKNNIGIFLVGNGQQAVPLPFQAGLVCAGGAALRFPGANTGAYGTLHLTHPFAFADAYFQPGGTYLFQAWYRDSAPNSPCGTTSNLSNGYSVTLSS